MTITNDYNKAKELLEKRHRVIEALRTTLNKVIDLSAQRDSENKRIMEMLERDRAAMWRVIQPNINMNKKDIQGLMDYLAQRCSYDLCDEAPENLGSIDVAE